MLVLSRRETERIRLGDSIVVTVIRVSGDKVRLGIEAPRDILVLREELEVHSEEPPAAEVDGSASSPLAAPTPATGAATAGESSSTTQLAAKAATL